MEFKYALSILFSNIGYVIKILLWVLLSMVLTAAIGAAILIPIFSVIVETTDIMTYINAISSSLSGLLDGNISIREVLTAVTDNVPAAIDAMTENAGAATGLVFAALFIYMFYSFLVGLSHYTTADIINKLMSSNLRFGYASNMALNFKNSCRYSFARLLVALPVDIILFIVMAVLAFGLYSAIKIFAIPILLVVGVLLLSLRAMLFSGWLPRMLYHPEERVFTNLARSFTFIKTNFAGFFKAYSITFTCAYLLTAAFMLPTIGFVVLVVPPIYYFLLRTVELIGYYKVKGYSFYTDSATVVDTIDFGFRSDNQGKIDLENGEAYEMRNMSPYNREFDDDLQDKQPSDENNQLGENNQSVDDSNKA